MGPDICSCPKTISPQSKERRERDLIRIPERGILIRLSPIKKKHTDFARPDPVGRELYNLNFQYQRGLREIRDLSATIIGGFISLGLTYPSIKVDFDIFLTVMMGVRTSLFTAGWIISLTKKVVFGRNCSTITRLRFLIDLKPRALWAEYQVPICQIK